MARLALALVAGLVLSQSVSANYQTCPADTTLTYVKQVNDNKWVWAAGDMHCSGCPGEGTQTQWNAATSQCQTIGAAPAAAAAPAVVQANAQPASSSGGYRICNADQPLTFVSPLDNGQWLWSDQDGQCSGCQPGTTWDNGANVCRGQGSSSSSSSSSSNNNAGTSNAGDSANAAPAVAAQAAVQQSGNNGGNNGGAQLQGETFSGRATYYNTRAFGEGGQTTTGVGSCGGQLWDSDFVVAMNSAQYSSSNCGRGVCIQYNGNTVRASMLDLCPECPWGAIDLTPATYKALTGGSLGMLSSVTWSWC